MTEERSKRQTDIVPLKYVVTVDFRHIRFSPTALKRGNLMEKKKKQVVYLTEDRRDSQKKFIITLV